MVTWSKLVNIIINGMSCFEILNIFSLKRGTVAYSHNSSNLGGSLGGETEGSQFKPNLSNLESWNQNRM